MIQLAKANWAFRLTEVTFFLFISRIGVQVPPRGPRQQNNILLFSLSYFAKYQYYALHILY